MPMMSSIDIVQEDHFVIVEKEPLPPRNADALREQMAGGKDHCKILELSQAERLLCFLATGKDMVTGQTYGMDFQSPLLNSDLHKKTFLSIVQASASIAHHLKKEDGWFARVKSLCGLDTYKEKYDVGLSVTKHDDLHSHQYSIILVATYVIERLYSKWGKAISLFQRIATLGLDKDHSVQINRICIDHKRRLLTTVAQTLQPVTQGDLAVIERCIVRVHHNAKHNFHIHLEEATAPFIV